MLEEERRRREEAERRLQDETAHRQRLVEEEVKMREKHFSQVSGAAGGDEGGGVTGDVGMGMRDETLKERLGVRKIKDWEGNVKKRKGSGMGVGGQKIASSHN